MAKTDLVRSIFDASCVIGTKLVDGGLCVSRLSSFGGGWWVCFRYCCYENRRDRLIEGEELIVVQHAPQPMRHGVGYTFVNLHSTSFPLLAFLSVCASVRAGVGLSRREC